MGPVICAEPEDARATSADAHHQEGQPLGIEPLILHHTRNRSRIFLYCQEITLIPRDGWWWWAGWWPPRETFPPTSATEPEQQRSGSKGARLGPTSVSHAAGRRRAYLSWRITYTIDTPSSTVSAANQSIVCTRVCALIILGQKSPSEISLHEIS